MKTYDLIVIGGGSGGVRAARVAAASGAKVLLAEESRIGGTCVIRGCVPKKLMVMASRIGMEIQDGAGFGWTFDGARFSWLDLKRQIDAELDRLEHAYSAALDLAGVRVMASRAELLGDGRVRLCATSENVHGERILIATGAYPTNDDDLPGRSLCATSDDFFNWTTQPRRVVVQGGGYIALELGCLLSRLGSDVSIVFRGSHLLRGFDQELREHLQTELVAAGLQILPKSRIAAVEQDLGELRVALFEGSAIATDAVIRAVGRRPNVHGLGLERAGVVTDATGGITIDEDFQTSAPGVFAIGDVTNRIQLTPVAIREGHSFAETIFAGKKNRSMPSELTPTAIFTSPELATVGLTEAEAVARHVDVDIYTTHFRPMKATLSGRPGRCFMKLVVNRTDDRVLGIHLIGSEVAEMIQLLGVALTVGLRKSDLNATLPVHPTIAEELVTMRVPVRRHGHSEAA
jgi:glutathione reductase (NADPH)